MSIQDTVRPAGTRALDAIEGLQIDSSELAAKAHRALESRLRLLVETLGDDVPDDMQALVEAAGDLVDAPDRLWLAHSIIAGELPTHVRMTEMVARLRLHGAWAALAPALRTFTATERHREVRLVTDAVTCDVHLTASSDYLSGIQRVVRETVGRWNLAHEIEFVGWTPGFHAMRSLRSDERDRLFEHDTRTVEEGAPPLVVPWHSTHVLAEVSGELGRNDRLVAMGRHSPNTVSYVGYDVIPVTSAATVTPGMTSNFVRYLSAVRQGDRIGMISAAAVQEFRGWLGMGAGRGDHGPESAVVSLPVSSQASTQADLDEARVGLVVDSMPMVLVVGSHEPRKNHLAVLHAAERLWREGHRFNLVLVGAGSWNAAAYQTALQELLGSGRPVQSIRGLPDRLLWAAYRLAHVTLFPSLNEGFGLPVAESLAAGTPVITSDFGSMRDIAAPEGTPLGALLVDPRDDDSLTDALRTLLTDQRTYDRLKAETREHKERSWDEYATELWDFLVDGVRPPGDPGD